MRANIPLFDQDLRQNIAMLAVLIGRPPVQVVVKGGSLFRLSIPRVTPGLPSELLFQRPDIRAAEANLASADASVESARAAFFPSISLTGQGGYQSNVLKLLFTPQNAFYNLAANVTQPLLDGFRLEGQLELTQGRQFELLKIYRQSILAGFRDVELALIAIADGAERERLQQLVVNSSREAFNLAENRLREGTVDLVTVLQTQQTLFTAENNLVLARFARLQAVLSLFQALGGSWMPPGVGAGGVGRQCERDPMMLKRRLTVLLIAGLVIAGVVAVYYMPQWQQTQAASKGGRRGGPPATDPVPVLAIAARATDVPVYLDGVGTAKALNTVTVRSQVDGKLINISFTEGQDVPKGFVLAKIDPTTYQAQYDQAQAKKAQDEAQLANARLDLDRYTRAGGDQRGQQAAARHPAGAVSQLEAQIKLDQAAIDNARAILGYTDVVAPIAGRTGIRLVDEGNIVRGADTTGIVILTQFQPISVFFNLPQQNLPDLNQGMAEGQLPVEALTPDGKSALDNGKVVVIDNQVDQTTGTVKLKAEFPNTNLQLWPGQFVNVRVLIDTLRNVVVVPTAAVQRGPNGTFVYVVKDDNTVTVRRVKLTQQDDVRAVVGDGPEGRRAGGHDRLCPAHRGHAGHRVERGRCRPGRAATVRATRRMEPAVRARGERGKRSSSTATAGPHAMSVSSPFIQRPDRNLAARHRRHAGRHPRLSVAAGLLAAAGRLSRPSRSPPSFRAPAPTPWRRW